MYSRMNDTVADRDDMVALLMGTEGVSSKAAAQALDECGGDVDRAMAWLGGDSKEVAAQYKATPKKDIVCRPSHIHRHRKGDIDDPIDQPPTQHHDRSLRGTPSPVASFQPRDYGYEEARDDGYEEEGDKKRGDTKRSALNTFQKPSPMVARSAVHSSLAVTEPGAIAVPGVGGVAPNSDEYTLSPPMEAPSTTPAANQREPVITTAHVVRDSDQDFHVLQSQIRQQGEQLEQLRRRQDNVAVGQVIDEEAQDEALPTDGSNKGSDDESTSLLTPRRKWIVAAAVVLAIIGIVVGVTLSTKPSPTPVPSQDLIDLLSSASLDGGAALQSPSTPQNKALTWLAGNANLDSYSNEKKIQRYVLATFYYSTNGDGWNYNAGWLSDNDECSWYNAANRVFCTIDGQVLEFDFYDTSAKSGNNLVGTIPVELALLSNSLDTLTLADNSLIETIPTEIGLLTRLGTLLLWGNSFTGTIPSQIGLLSSLKVELALAKNSLRGTIPSEIGTLSNLKRLILWGNSLTGTIPSQIGFLTSLTDLQLSTNSLVGTIPSAIGSLRNLFYLSLFGNDFSGEFTCPDFITKCYVSCKDDANVECRSN